MRIILLTGATVLAAIAAQSASAQLNSSFRGVYVEAQAGGDRFQSQGIHDDKFGFGVAGGFDGVINDRWVIGPQFGYWRARGENKTAINGGSLNNKGFEEYSAGIRAGYLVTPKILVYGAGGYTNNEQRLAYTGANGTTAGRFYDHSNVGGYYVGAGGEYSISDRFYVGGGYRYSDYSNHTAHQRLFLTAGVRFK